MQCGGTADLGDVKTERNKLSRKSARELFAYCGTEPLPTLGTLTTDVSLTGNNSGRRADFVVVKGDGRTLLVVKPRKFSCTLIPSKRTIWTVEDFRVVSGRNRRPSLLVLVF